MTILHNQAPYRILYDISTHLPTYHSFAIDDALCQSIGKYEAKNAIRFWVHAPTIVLGLQDLRLPRLHEGVQYLQSQGYDVIVRNSGGLAVVLDENILNISLFFHERNGKMSIDAAYEEMYTLITEVLSPFSVTVEAKEIVGSYCPGSYDLSIHNKKFAGISQRRVRGGIAVQIYLCLRESGEQRASLIQHFYEKALNGEDTKVTYPTIVPETMASLEDLLQSSIDVPTFLSLLDHALQKNEIKYENSVLTDVETQLYQNALPRMIQRNEEHLGVFFKKIY